MARTCMVSAGELTESLESVPASAHESWWELIICPFEAFELLAAELVANAFVRRWP